MKRVFIIAVLLLVGLPASAYAQEPAEGEITGQVVNGTEGGGSVAGVEITLITYVDNMMSETRTTIADDEGNFQFGSVATEHTYLVSAEYMGVAYYYPVTFESGTATAHVEAGVCDVTTSDQAIRVGLAHTMINVEGDSLLITEVYWLVNDGDMTYVGEDGALVFTLPEGAYSFEAPPELLMDYELLDNNTITYLVPFPPGERQLAYSYRLTKPDAAEYTIPLEVNYTTDSLELMVAGEDIEAAVAQLAPAEPVVTDTGERFIHFQGKNLPRHTIINLRLANLSGGSGFPRLTIWVIITVVVAGTAVYLMIRRKRRVDTGG
jgi:hypothetical protein